MSTKLLLVLGILLGVLALAMLWPPGPDRAPELVEPSGELLRSSRFVLEREGTRWLDESFSLFLMPDGGRLLILQSTLTVSGVPIRIAAQTQYDGEYRPIAYQLAAETPTGTQIVSAQRAEGALRMEARAGAARQSSDLALASDPLLLDNNVIAHYVILFEAIRAGSIAKMFSAAVPQALAGIPSRWEDPVPTRIQSGDRFYDGRKIAIHLGDVAIDLVSFEGRLVGLVNRTQGTVAYDVDLLPSGLRLLETEAASPLEGFIEKPASFRSTDLALSGTLCLPSTQTAPLCAVLLVAGSGPVDRDGNAPGFPMDAYRQLAHALARSGIASLRYDKRGVGASQGDATAASRSDLMSDVRAAWDWLGAQPELVGVRRVALGHSEGAYLVEELAADNPSVDGLILLCGSPQSLAAVTRWQVETLLRAQGALDEQVAAALAQEDEYLAFVKSSAGQWTDYRAAELRKALPWLTEAAAEQLKASPLGLAWLREHYNADPVAVLARVTCPVLVVSASKDVQVPPADGEALAVVLRRAGNTSVTSLVIADLNHVLRHHPEEPNLIYQHLDEPVDERVAGRIVAWIKTVWGD